MRVERLFVQNLGPIERVELELKPVTVLMGPNEAGKSFLLEALGVLRFGTCRGIKVGESHALTRGGAKGWAVEATVSVNPEAESLILRRTRSEGPDAATLDGAMGDARVWRALLDGRSFLTIKPDERKALVADLLARDTGDLVEVLVAKGASQDIVDAVREGNLRRAFRLAEEARRAVGRVLEETDAVLRVGADDPVVPTRSGDKPISTIELATIQKALDNARAAWTSALKGADAAARRRTTVEAGRAAAEELAALVAPPAWTAADEKRSKDVERLLGKGKEKAAEIDAECGVVVTGIEKARARLKAEGPCSVCGQVMTPDARARVEQTIVEEQARVVAYRKEATGLTNEAETLRKEAKGLAERKAKDAAHAEAKARLQTKIDAGEKAGEDAETEDPEPLEREVRRLEGLREMRVRYDGRAEGVAAAKARRANLIERRDLAAEIEKCVVPDRMDDEGAALEAINAACLEYAPAIMGGPWVSVSQSWDVAYNGLRVELASDSASLRTGLVIALALSRLSGVKCVFADRLESLDDGTRARVVTLLGDLVAKGEIETAIVATVRKEPPAPSAVPDWLGRVWVEGGKAKFV